MERLKPQVRMAVAARLLRRAAFIPGVWGQVLQAGDAAVIAERSHCPLHAAPAAPRGRCAVFQLRSGGHLPVRRRGENKCSQMTGWKAQAGG